MRAGKLDRGAWFHRPKTTVDEAGVRRDDPKLKAFFVWGELIEPKTREALRNGVEIATGKAVLRIRWRADVTLDHVVQITRGTSTPSTTAPTWAITGIREIGRRRGLDLDIERLDP